MSVLGTHEELKFEKFKCMCQTISANGDEGPQYLHAEISH